MSAQALRNLRAAHSSQIFERVYYLHGDDEYRKDAAIRELAAAAVDPATRDFNLDLLRGGEISPEQLESALNTPPMMAARRLVILRDVGSLKKDTRLVLERYLAHPAGDTVVVLVAPAGIKADTALERKATAIKFGPLFESELSAWIVQHAHAVHGRSITREALHLLQLGVGSDVAQLAAELDKLASYVQEGEIDERAVSDVVGVRRGETLGDFLDRIAERDAPAALALVDHILAQPKNGLVPIIMALTVQTMAIGWALAARKKGLQEQRLQGELIALVKETGAHPWRLWSEAAACWARNHMRWDVSSVERGLDLLLAADRGAKDTRLSTDEQLLSTLIVALCAPARRTAA